MGKVRLSVMLLCSFLILTGCQNQALETSEWSELWGNSSGNILEGGYIATNGEAICYTGPNDVHNSLYKLDQGGEPILLSNKLAYQLNMVNDRMYFVSGLPGPICSIRTDGTDFITHAQGKYSNLFVSETHMVYLDRGNLVVSNLAGTGRTVIASDVRKFIPFNGTLVFATTEGLYQVNPDGGDLQCLHDEAPVGLCSNSTYLYFSVSNDIGAFGKAGGRVYRMDGERTIDQLPVEIECWDMNAIDDFLFFRNQTKQGALYRMDVDGSNLLCLLEENCTDVNIIGESLIFRVVTTGKGLSAGYYVVSQDGNNLRLFTGYNFEWLI